MSGMDGPKRLLRYATPQRNSLRPQLAKALIFLAVWVVVMFVLGLSLYLWKPPPFPLGK